MVYAKLLFCLLTMQLGVGRHMKVDLLKANSRDASNPLLARSVSTHYQYLLPAIREIKKRSREEGGLHQCAPSFSSFSTTIGLIVLIDASRLLAPETCTNHGYLQSLTCKSCFRRENIRVQCVCLLLLPFFFPRSTATITGTAKVPGGQG